MSFGATLRLLRLQSGLGLRDLARRLGVSSAYLSRIENGIDPAPTPARLQTLAQELGVASSTLIQIARRVSPLLNEYVEHVPEAGALFADVALRNLNAEQLSEVQAFVARRFPTRSKQTNIQASPIAHLLSEDRLILGLRCARMNDALHMAAGRLAVDSKCDAASIAAALKTRETELGIGIGSGVAMVCATLPKLDERAAVITFSEAPAYPTPDNQPLRLLFTLIGNRETSCFRQRVAEVARLVDLGLADALCKCDNFSDFQAALRQLEGPFKQ